MVDLLLKHGANVHAEDDVALREAAEYGHTPVVDLLLKNGANVHARDDEALRNAAKYGDTSVVELLLINGADVEARTIDPEGYWWELNKNALDHAREFTGGGVVRDQNKKEVVDILTDYPLCMDMFRRHIALREVPAQCQYFPTHPTIHRVLLSFLLEKKVFPHIAGRNMP